ncbi:nuclear transport factor 2 family protein [Micromonospora sp. WMMD1082]|uniref:nuclear transport factor 2 family protein n=1 Tax=Micromonospora sp. WMMD1082 TaxID=3016104 RepID=UPI002416FB82|nr:nuclear transport factor 2 family protein [Micromonospora sp. WMMD1082]MDG4795747.1 nuclear transport factor 2 family protein [Micromonospora sp. WMMD1082]
MNAKEIVLSAAEELFGNKDVSAVDRWTSPDYIQHSAYASGGLDGVRQMLQYLPPGFRYDLHRVIADGNHVALHGTFHGFGPMPLIAFNVYRVEDGRLAEHWENLTPVVDETVSGTSQTAGVAQVDDLHATDDNRRLITHLMEAVLKGRPTGAVAEFFDTEHYIEHGPGSGTALGVFGGDEGVRRHDTLHKVIAEGNFVLTLSEGRSGATPTAYYDLFRVEDGKIVEHWDVVSEIKSDLPHSNGLF